jgi:hypothetical protein
MPTRLVRDSSGLKIAGIVGAARFANTVLLAALTEPLKKT